MRIAAVLLSLSLLMPAYGQQAQEVAAAQASPASLPAAPPVATAEVLPPLTVTAPRPETKQIRELKKVRTTGGIVAGAGAGLCLTAGVITLGGFFVVWGAAWLFFGGLTAYLSHRRLQGKEDFGPAGEADSSQPGVLPAPESRADGG
jgi:hypothetical protein